MCCTFLNVFIMGQLWFNEHAIKIKCYCLFNCLCNKEVVLKVFIFLQWLSELQIVLAFMNRFFFNLKRNVLIFEKREPHGKEAKVSIIILFFVIFIFDLLVLILIFRFLFCLLSSWVQITLCWYLNIFQFEVKQF